MGAQPLSRSRGERGSGAANFLKRPSLARRTTLLMKLSFSRAWIAAGLLALGGMLTTGCTMVDRVRGQMSETFETAMADGDEKLVYDTTRACLEAMGYEYERGNPSGHRLEMATRIQPGGDAQNLRQRRVVVQFSAMGSEGTEVKIGFWETTEETSQKDNAVVGSRLIRGGALYQAFWQRLEKALPERPLSGSAPGTGAPAPAAAP